MSRAILLALALGAVGCRQQPAVTFGTELPRTCKVGELFALWLPDGHTKLYQCLKAFDGEWRERGVAIERPAAGAKP